MPRKVNESLKHENKSISQNESLTEYTIKNKISQLLFKYKSENDIHEHAVV